MLILFILKIILCCDKFNSLDEISFIFMTVIYEVSSTILTIKFFVRLFEMCTKNYNRLRYANVLELTKNIPITSRNPFSNS